MKAYRLQQLFQIALSITFLATGSLIYVVCRPDTLLLFTWADTVGLEPTIRVLRTTLADKFLLLPEWFVYSAPFALWVASYVTIVKLIWSGCIGIGVTAWILAVPILAVSAELGQLVSLVPGTFDYFDLVLIITVSIIASIEPLKYAKKPTPPSRVSSCPCNRNAPSLREQR